MKAFWTFNLIVFLLATAVPAWSADGLVKLTSSNSPAVTMDRLQRIVTEKGMKVFARINHTTGAATIGKTLRPTELLIFGNPQGGTPFMECAQSVGIDLPIKALVWEDAAGKVWLGYNDPAYIAMRHGVSDCTVVPNMTGALENFARYATSQ
jgi:uncharacterized protein (DUF302 family)